MKKSISVLLAVCLLITCIPVLAATPAFSGTYASISSAYKNGFLGPFAPQNIFTKSGSGGTKSISGVDYKASSASPWANNGGFAMVIGDWGRYEFVVPYTGVYVLQIRCDWIRNTGVPAEFYAVTDEGYCAQFSLYQANWSSSGNEDKLIYLRQGTNVITISLNGATNAVLGSINIARLDASGASRSLDFLPLVETEKPAYDYPENITTVSIDNMGNSTNVWSNVLDYSDASVSHSTNLWLAPKGWAAFEVAVPQTGFYYVQIKSAGGQTTLRTIADGYYADVPVSAVEQFYCFDLSGAYQFIYLMQGVHRIYLQNIGDVGCEIIRYEWKASMYAYDNGSIPEFADLHPVTKKEATVLSVCNINIETHCATMSLLRLPGGEEHLTLVLADYGDSGQLENLSVTFVDASVQTADTKQSYSVCLNQSILGTAKFFVFDEALIPYFGLPFEAENPEAHVYAHLYVSPDGDDLYDGSKNAPVRTLERANALVAQIAPNMTDDIVVHFAGGDYPVGQMMTINESVSGKNGYQVIYKGDDRDHPPIFNAGTHVSGWQPQADSPIWVASAPDITDTRTLYINDRPASLARSRYRYQPVSLYYATGSSYSSDGIQVKNTNFPSSFTNPQDVMLCWPILWTMSRTPVNNIIRGRVNTILEMQQPQWSTHTTMGYSHLMIGTAREFIIENALEVLDEPGEFYFDKTAHKMYYYPYEEEDLTTAEVYAGTTEKMLYLGGSSSTQKASNIVLDNLTFKYSALNEINQKGVKFNQADHEWSCYTTAATGYYDRLFPGQITVNYADSVIIKNCDFACLGSNGINMDNGVTNSMVIGNIFRDISGTALVLGHFLHGRTLSSGQERVVNVEVANNVIRRVANEYTGCTAISIYYAKAIRVHHNDIKDIPYTGITIGWGWGADVPDCRDISVTYNRIENVTQKTKDGAHLYTLSRMESTHLSNNYLINAGDYRGGIYLDAGTEAITMENNVVTGSTAMIYARSGAEISECVARNNYTDTTLDYCDDDVCTEIGTVRVTDGNWPASAVSVMNEAGLQPNYRGLLERAEYPQWRILAYQRYADEVFTSNEIVDINRWIIAKEYTSFYEISHSKPSVYAGGEVGDTRPGEWLEFTFEVPTAGYYYLQLRCSDGNTASSPACTAKLDLDGTTLTDSFTIPRDGWDLKDLDVGRYSLSVGTHTFRITVQGMDWMIGGFKFDNNKALPDSSDYDEGKVIDQATLWSRYGS